jgi:integrase
MVRANIPGVFATYKNLKNGMRRAYWYHRATGRRLNGEPGTAKFIADFAAAEKTLRDRLAGTFNGLIRDFTTSQEFEKLAATTQGDYRRLLKYAEVVFGHMPLAALEDRRVRKDFLEWRDKVAKASGPRAADYRLSAISAMLTWATKRTILSGNNLTGFERLYTADRSEKIWLPENIQSFMRAAPVELQRALIVALHTGQRQGDLLRLAWSNYDGSAISIRQSKTKRRVVIPCTAALRRLLDALPRPGLQVLSMSNGLPWKAYSFRHAWKMAADVAGIEGLHFHDLRGTAVTMLAEAGCTIAEIASITGHSLNHANAILEKYMARTRHLADAAIIKFENAKGTEFANQLQTAEPSKLIKEAK